ncbi:hypothetical protein GCM10009599_14390 [Luteococcus peritonei]
MLQSGEEPPENALTDPDMDVRIEAERIAGREPEWHRMTTQELRRRAQTADRYELSVLAQVCRDRGDHLTLMHVAGNPRASIEVLRQAEMNGTPAVRATALNTMLKKGIRSVEEVAQSGSVRERIEVAKLIPETHNIMASDRAPRVRREVASRVSMERNREAVLHLAGDEDRSVREALLFGEAGGEAACIALFHDDADDDLRTAAREKAVQWIEQHPEPQHAQQASLLDELFGGLFDLI